MNPPSYNRILGGWAGPHLVLVPKLPHKCRPGNHCSEAKCYVFLVLGGVSKLVKGGKARHFIA